MFDTEKSIVQELFLPQFNKRNIQLFVKRDDLIDDFVSGNKWRKLKYNIAHTKQQKKTGILTFGGAFSNHLLATASACNAAGLRSLGLVRGDELNPDSNNLLKKCAELGMQLKFISREEYHLRKEKSYHEELTFEFPNYQIVPEGGSNYYGMIGCQEILQETSNDFDHIFIAQGTTTTSAGIALGLKESCQLHVVPVLKGFDAKAEMNELFKYSGIESEMVAEILERTAVLSEYHFGGYGKYTSELLDFMEMIFKITNVPLDPVYTGKAFFALVDWVTKTNATHSKILFIHTGGIQGGKFIEQKEGRTFS
jgi:1-aminocyclopropane-1-carboxylate deaminase